MRGSREVERFEKYERYEEYDRESKNRNMKQHMKGLSSMTEKKKRI
jgi:hypothetical protein